MEKNLTVNQLYQEIQKLIAGNSASALDFTLEAERAQIILATQQELVSVMRKINQEIQGYVASHQTDITINHIKELKQQFEQLHSEYQSNYTTIQQMLEEIT